MRNERYRDESPQQAVRRHSSGMSLSSQRTHERPRKLQDPARAGRCVPAVRRNPAQPAQRLGRCRLCGYGQLCEKGV